MHLCLDFQAYDDEICDYDDECLEEKICVRGKCGKTKI